MGEERRDEAGLNVGMDMYIDEGAGPRVEIIAPCPPKQFDG